MAPIVSIDTHRAISLGECYLVPPRQGEAAVQPMPHVIERVSAGGGVVERVRGLGESAPASIRDHPSPLSGCVLHRAGGRLDIEQLADFGDARVVVPRLECTPR